MAGGRLPWLEISRHRIFTSVPFQKSSQSCVSHDSYLPRLRTAYARLGPGALRVPHVLDRDRIKNIVKQRPGSEDLLLPSLLSCSCRVQVALARFRICCSRHAGFGCCSEAGSAAIRYFASACVSTSRNETEPGFWAAACPPDG